MDESNAPRSRYSVIPRSGKPILYFRLKVVFNHSHLTKAEFADKIGISKPTLDTRMLGRADWRLFECYAALDALHIPRNMLHVYLPSNGIDNDAKKGE